MGQYWYPVNLDKKEFVSPHKLGAGLKLWEQAGTWPGTGTALIVLCAAMPEARGGGDLDLTGAHPGPMPEGCAPEGYAIIAKRTIGRWAGDRVALVGDYAEDSDLPLEFRASTIYDLCSEKAEGWTDVSDDVCAVIEHEFHGQFSGEGWREFERVQL